MPVILFKPIHPARLQVRKMNTILKKELDTISKDILFDFEVTCHSFQKKPKFQRLVSVGPNSVDILVGTDDEVYRYLDEGTKRHFVAPRNAPALAWRTGAYQTKTIAGKMVAGPGKPAAGPYAYDAKGHFVKGIRARKFTKTIQKMWDKKFKTRMEKAMREAARASGNFYSAASWK